MTKPELIEIIREVVKAELRNVGPMLVREALLESLQGNTESIAPRPVTTPQRQAAPKQLAEIRQPRKEVKYSNNPILNQILNETDGGVPSGPGDGMVPSVDFTPNSSALVPPDGTRSILDVIQNAPPEVLNENKEIAAVTSALTRDYRSVLKNVNAAVASRKGLLR